MAGRNDAAIVATLEAVAQAVGQQPNANVGANAEVKMLVTFLRNHPPTFKGRYDPVGAQTCSRRLRGFSGLCSAMRCKGCVLVRTCWQRKVVLVGEYPTDT